MAGIISAISWKTPRVAGIFQFNHPSKAPFSHLPSLPISWKTQLLSLPIRRNLNKMAHNNSNNNNNNNNVPETEITEPSPKIPKLQQQNGVHEVSRTHAAPFFRVKKLSDKAVFPSRASPLSAGYDLSSASETKVPARGKALIPTDLSIAVPEGTYARIAPRSGLAWKHSIDVGAGVIDADYRGSIGVILFNHSDVDFQVEVGDRIAQLIIQQIITPEVVEVEDLDATVRGEGGFGSTGV